MTVKLERLGEMKVPKHRVLVWHHIYLNLRKSLGFNAPQHSYGFIAMVLENSELSDTFTKAYNSEQRTEFSRSTFVKDSLYPLAQMPSNGLSVFGGNW